MFSNNFQQFRGNLKTNFNNFYFQKFDLITRYIFAFSITDPPEILKTSETILIDPGQNAQLECEIDANPFSNSVIGWRRLRTEDDQQELASLIESDERQRILVENGDLYSKHTDIDLSRFEVQFEQNKAILVIHNVTKTDSGVYLCIANNQIGNPANGTTQLIVKRKCY